MYQFLAAAARADAATNAAQILADSRVRALLLDFGSEASHDARVEKHGVALALAASAAAVATLDATAAGMLQTYARKGPYMTVVQDRAEVGTAGAES